VGPAPGTRCKLASVNRRPLTVVILGALPMVLLGFLLLFPRLDVPWEHHPSHFWLVLGVALISVGLGLATSAAARQRSDARVFLVSMAFLSSAAFLGLHALATPDILLAEPNTGFVIATPIGLLLGSGFAAASALPLEEAGLRWVRRWHAALRLGLAALVVAWAVGSLTGLPFLERPFPDEVPGGLRVIALAGVVLYAVAAIRYWSVYRRRGIVLPLAISVAFVLLAEAMVTVAFSRSWRISWWEWHVLMAIAFLVVTLAARREYRRRGSLTAAFGGLYLQATLERVDRRHAEALAELARVVDAGEPVAPVVARLAPEGFSAEELTVLEQSARELSRLDALFRPYVGPALAERLRREPDLATLGGTEHEATVLFADLAGFTSFSEGRNPTEVIDMLNAYWAVAVPLLSEREDGLIERFAGDAVLVVFNALGDQPDHALRAARSALDLRDQAERIWGSHAGWPRFRFGLNTGPVVVGNVGAGGQRSFSVVGDTANVAARIQSEAQPGQVFAGPETVRRIRGRVEVISRGQRALKGKARPLELFEMIRIAA
jgi:adenylate cyclase